MAEYNNDYYGNYSSTDYNARPTYRQADQQAIDKKPKDKGILILPKVLSRDTYHVIIRVY